MTFQLIIDEIKANLNTVLADIITDTSIDFTVEPAKSGFADVTSNVAFLLSRVLRRSPRELAFTLSEMYSKHPFNLVKKVTAHPSGYINFFADWEKLSKLILSRSFDDKFGCLDIGHKSTIVVEHTSVNPNKAIHIGHIRNIIIGDTISRILKKVRYNVNILNYVDDSGLQVADIIVGFQHLKLPIEPPSGKKFDHYCGDDIYVKTTKMYENDSTLDSIRNKTLKSLEDGNSETAKFADLITGRVLKNQLATCWNLGVRYDCLNYESHIIRSGLWKKVFEKLKQMSLITFEDSGKNIGCWVIQDNDVTDIDDKKKKVLVRSNGTATYIAKDIPYAAWKLGLLDDPFQYEEYSDDKQPIGADGKQHILWRTRLKDNDDTINDSKRYNDDNTHTPSRFSGEKVITVVDSRQANLQHIVSSLMDRFKSSPDAYVHLGYESVTLSSETAKILGLDTEGKSAQMSGRKGLYINADAVYEKIYKSATVETKRRNPDLDDNEVNNIAHSISVGTIRYEMLKQDLDRIIAFDLTKSLRLDGDTASYIQYTGARASRILEKTDKQPNLDVDFGLLKSKTELDLIQIIGLFETYVGDAARNLAPKVLTKYCHDLAVKFNLFYESAKVLCLEDEALEDARLCLVASFQSTLERALEILGVPVPNRM